VATDLLENTNCEVIREGEYSVLKILLLSQIDYCRQEFVRNPARPSNCELPTCPVCLQRIDPLRLGLPKPPNRQLCSKFCPSPTLLADSPRFPPCPRQRLLVPWPAPSRCVCCRTVAEYWKTHNKAHASAQRDEGRRRWGQR
jgi:hypothetical protein